jgi:hypothetical protein
MTAASSRSGPTFRVIAADNHAGLAVGTLLVETRRYEIWSTRAVSRPFARS